MQERIYGFPPVADANARILIVGSMPSVKSLEEEFYYAHPRNDFWRILAELFGSQRPRTVAGKRAMLLQNRVALWDAVHACERTGSLDSAIRNAEGNDFAELFLRCPSIDRVYANGQTAGRLLLRFAGPALCGRAVAVLPSTSPALTLPYDKKLAAWRRILTDETEDER